MTVDIPRFSLSELADAADVSPRTVRYYIAEGLLPPPVGAGHASAYTAAHLDRLRLIGQLKAAYLPLREIRRRLAGLSDGAVRDLLDETESRAPRPDSAGAYLDRVLGARPPVTFLAEPVASDVYETGHVPAEELRRGRARSPAPPARRGDHAMPDARASPDETWRRVRLSDDAELLIREAAYHRRPDRIEWLIGWARKVFN